MALLRNILFVADLEGDSELAFRAAVDLASKTAAELHVVCFLEEGLGAANEERARAKLEKLCGQAGELGAGVVQGHLLEDDMLRSVPGLVKELSSDLLVAGAKDDRNIRQLIRRIDCSALLLRQSFCGWPPSRVVVGEDSSRSAAELARSAAGLAALLGARLLLVRAYPVVLHVVEAANFSERAPASLEEALRRHESDLYRRARRLREDYGVSCGVRVNRGDAASVILDVASEDDVCSLVAVARRGLGVLDRFRMGSVSERVLKAAEGPVLVYVPGGRGAANA